MENVQNNEPRMVWVKCLIPEDLRVQIRISALNSKEKMETQKLPKLIEKGFRAEQSEQKNVA